jgi:hypothetical protein
MNKWLACFAVLLLTISSLSRAAEPNAETKTYRDVVFGPTQHLSGVYVTNFELNNFFACDSSRGECANWIVRDGEAVWCEAVACADLERRIVELNGSHNNWAAFSVMFLGRRAVQRHPNQSMHDTESKIFLERIERFVLLEK